jgi:hypothetical protein
MTSGNGRSGRRPPGGEPADGDGQLRKTGLPPSEMSYVALQAGLARHSEEPEVFVKDWWEKVTELLALLNVPVTVFAL